jgi:hypothetical protein
MQCPHQGAVHVLKRRERGSGLVNYGRVDQTFRENQAAPARREGKIRLPRRAQVFLPRLEAGFIPLPFLGKADVQGLGMGRLEAHPRRLHALHD